MAKQDNEMQIGVEDKEAPPEKIVADGKKKTSFKFELENNSFGI